MPVTLLSHQFSDADGTALASCVPETGTWVNHTGAGVNRTASDRCRGNGASTGIDRGGTAPSGFDYWCTGRFRQVTAAETFAVCVRVQTGSTTMYAAQRFTGSDLWRLVKIVSGTVTLIDSWAETLSDGDERTVELKVETSGTDARLTVTIAGTLRIDRTDSSITSAAGHTAGYPGVRSTGGTDTTGIHLDWFTAEEAGGGGAASRETLLLLGV